jgi:hypothetical protein
VSILSDAPDPVLVHDDVAVTCRSKLYLTRLGSGLVDVKGELLQSTM